MLSENDVPPVAIVRFPATATRPIFVRFEGVEIEAAICTRETYASKRDLAPNLWSVCGIYVLTGPSDNSDCDARVRPGTTQTRPLLERVDEHLTHGEAWWRQVILIRRLTRQFDNAESGYLGDASAHHLQDCDKDRTRSGQQRLALQWAVQHRCESGSRH